MERTYTYDKKRYGYQVTAQGGICLAAAAYVAYVLATSGFSSFWLIVLIVAIYGAMSTFLINTYPKEIKVTNDGIAFFCRGKWDSYEIKKLKSFKVRSTLANYQLLVRVETKEGKSGKYWITVHPFNDSEDMCAEIYHIMKRVAPDDVIFRGREKLFNHRPGQEPAEKAYTEKDFMTPKE